MSGQTIQERNDSIVRQYNEGVPGTELAIRFELSRQRINQILRSANAVPAPEARAIRAGLQRQEFEQSVQSFLGLYRASLRGLAAAEAPRIEVERKFAVLAPEFPEAVRREAIRSSGLVFNVNREEVTFGNSMIEIGVWYALALEHNLRGDVPVALNEVSFAEMSEVSGALAELGATDKQIKEALVTAAAARQQQQADPSLSITANAYEGQRRVIIENLALPRNRGAFLWPPTHQTVKSRLGGGYWSDALASIGITASSRGRPRGLLAFEASDYRDAMADFLAHCDATGASGSLDAFEAWVLNEDRLGRQRPSGPSIRLRYGSWINAKRSALRDSQVEDPQQAVTTVAASAARTALHDASVERRAQLEYLESLEARHRASAMTTFIKDFMGVFEARRRAWFRGVVSNDPEAVSRRLTATPRLSRAQRTLLESSPANLGDALTDIYLDRLLSAPEGVRNADGWLADDAQAEMNAISDSDAAAAKVMRELRNYFTHDSTESQQRLTSAMNELGQLDGRFATSRPLTWRFLCTWLMSDDYRRFTSLTESILAAWRAMLAAEAIAAG